MKKSNQSGWTAENTQIGVCTSSCLSKNCLCGEQSLRQRTFTLIELLVVIAIIAILASMLMPALQQARERGKDIKCVNTIKQMGTYWQNYSDACNDYLLPSKGEPRCKGTRWPEIMIFSPETGIPCYTDADKEHKNLVDADKNIARFSPYLSCQSMLDNCAKFSAQKYTAYGNYPLPVSYGYNNELGHAAATEIKPEAAILKQSQFKGNTSSIPVFGEQWRAWDLGVIPRIYLISDVGSFKHAPFKPYSCHPGGSNFVMADLHAEKIAGPDDYCTSPWRFK